MTTSITARISQIRTEIHTKISQVDTNKSQCERLAARVDQLVEPLERAEHALTSLLRQETRPLLDSLLQCLDDCNHHIEQFTSSTQWCQETDKHQNDRRTFEELNRRLSQLGHDLCLGLHIQQIFDRKHDREDQQQDLQDLIQKLNEIPQQILQQQEEQYRLMDKRFDRRFQSFRYHLTQNLLMQQDSTEAQDLLVEHAQFLHIPRKDLDLEQNPIGQGGFADVYKGIWLTHHDVVAVKVLRINHLPGDSTSGVRADFYHEISTMYRIRYEHVLTVLGACIEPNFYAIVVEYMPLGSLYDVLHGKGGHDQMITISWTDRYSLAWQMAKSINYLHSFNPCILHRDIKSMNFLLKPNGSGDHKFIVKVCDFGLAKIRHQSILQSTMNSSSALAPTVGSLAWKAPELFEPHARHTKQSDVYSLGIVWWELATARQPWDEYADEIVILCQIKVGKRPNIPSDVPEEYKKCIEDAWNHDSHKRPTCFELMECICQQMKEKKERDNLTASNEQEDEVTAHAVDLHSPEIITPSPHSVGSTTDTNSTRTAVEVVDEEEQRRLTQPLSNTTTSDHQQAEAREKFEKSIIIETDKNVILEPSPIIQIEPKSALRKSTSSSFVNNMEQQSRTGTTEASDSSCVRRLERLVSKSADNLPSKFDVIDGTTEKQCLLPTTTIWGNNSNDGDHQDHSDSSLMEDLPIEHQRLVVPINLNKPEASFENEVHSHHSLVNRHTNILKSEDVSTATAATSCSSKATLLSISTIAGCSAPGAAFNELYYPFDICISNDHSLYITDSENRRLIEHSPNSIKLVLTTDQLNYPVSMCLDEENIYISDLNRILKYNRNTEQIHTIIDNIHRCYGLCMDKKNSSLYMSDYDKHCIVKWNENDPQIGLVCVAGGNSAGCHSNQLHHPRDICLDDSGENLFVCDYFNSRIQRFSLSSGVSRNGGETIVSNLCFPMGLTYHSDQSALYVADTGHNRILRYFLKTKQQQIIFGTSLGQGPSSRLFLPRRVLISNNDLFIVDTGNHRIQKVVLYRSSSPSEVKNRQITFQDIPGATEKSSHLPENYAQFQWDHVNYIHRNYAKKCWSGTGFQHSFQHGLYAVYNSMGYAIKIEHHNPFDVSSLEMNAIEDQFLEVKVNGYRDGHHLYQTIVKFRSTKSRKIKLNWFQIDSLVFEPVASRVHQKKLLPLPYFALSSLTVSD